MVSSTKKTHCSKEGYQWNRSSTKNAAFVALASIAKSFHKFQLGLRRVILKLANSSTPNKHSGYKVLEKVQRDQEEELTLCEELQEYKFISLDDLSFDHDPWRPVREEELKIWGGIQPCNFVCGQEFTSFHNNGLPPPNSHKKKTIFLDLDETLIHSMSDSDPPAQRFDFIVTPSIDGVPTKFYVLKRPGVDELLSTLARKYEVVIFTAGLKEYASLVLDKLDTKGLISHRLYRDSCKQVEGLFVKDLSETGRDLSNVVIVDDNPCSYLFQPSNAIPISSFTNDPNDTELHKLMKFFEKCDRFDDMRDAVRYLLP